MKQLGENKKKAIIVLIAIIIIAGIVMIATKGFSFELKYQDAQKIQLYVKQDFKVSDIQQITDEVLQGQPVLIQKVEVYGDMVSITSKEITDEQKANLVQKINEKYGTEISAEETEISNVPHTRGRDIIKPYIIPFALTTFIILVYVATRYYKLGALKMAFKTGIILVIAEMLLASIVAIVRIPIGKLTIPMAIAVYLLTLIGITTSLENELKEKKEKEKADN